VQNRASEVAGQDAWTTELGQVQMLGWFRALMPKDDRFFELFARHSRTLVDGAVALQRVLQGGEAMQEHARTVMSREQEADDITREVLLAVRRTFITPFDRSDIQDLIQSMDDAIDQMNKTVKAINLFEVRSFSPNMQEIGSAIVRVAELTAEAIPLLKAIGTNAAKIGAFAEEVMRVEDRADELHEVGLKALFRQGATNPMDYIVGSEILDHLEKVVDRFEDVANKVNSIMVENV
jgi:predicted phosphate transport protein (TIGR00153 family)